MIEIRLKLAPMSKPSATRNEAQSDWLALVAEQVGQLRFGVVQITVHDSRVVQIERTEKVRLDHPASDGRAMPTKSIGGQTKTDGQTDLTTGGS